MNQYLSIFRYMARFCADTGCQIMFKDFLGFTARDPGIASSLSPYTIHKSDYCIFLKNHDALWTCCHQASDRLRHHCEGIAGRGEDGCFTGMCYAGFSEMIAPVIWNGKLIAAICVGGFDLNREKSMARIHRTCETYGVNFDGALAAYDRSITAREMRPDRIEEACGVLSDFFRMYYTALVNAGGVDPQLDQAADVAQLNVLTNSLEYIHMNFDRDIRLRDIAAFCGCSESHLSHLFRKRMNCSIPHFINRVRVEQAQRLLADTGEGMREIAGRCGFADPNYFSTVFLRHVGMPPTAYRKLHWVRNAGELR